MADGTSLRFEVDSDGQITSVVDAQNRQTRFKYYKDGKLSETRFADGSTRTYRYDRLGMRRLREFDDGASVEYTYSAAGSMTEIRVKNSDETIDGQRLTLDEDQKVRVIERLIGGETSLTYDRMGNLITVTTGDQTTRFTYDHLTRLVGIVTPDGKRLTYSYQDGEPDLRLQMDHHTGRAFSERITSGLTFSSGLELLKNRTESSTFDMVKFDRAMMDYRLSSEQGVVLPDVVAVSAVERIRVMALGGSQRKDKKTFDAPSNVMFIPAEYWAVNCCPKDQFEIICDTDCPDPSPCEPGGGTPGPCELCCQNCCINHSTCNTRALSVFIAAEAACIAGVCTTQGPDSAACITCVTAAFVVYLIARELCDNELQTCRNQCAITHAGCQCH
jgi:YD repeat-containing protein